MEDVLDLIFKRRSIRIYDRKKLEKETITKLLQAAMAAPSASNSRPWEFVVVTEQETLDKLRVETQIWQLQRTRCCHCLRQSRHCPE